MKAWILLGQNKLWIQLALQKSNICLPTGWTFLVMLAENWQTYWTYVAHVNGIFMAKTSANFRISVKRISLIKVKAIRAWEWACDSGRNVEGHRPYPNLATYSLAYTSKKKKKVSEAMPCLTLPFLKRLRWYQLGFLINID